MLVIIGHLEFHPDDVSAAQAAARIMMIETMKEKGCIKYAFAVDLTQPTLLQLSEIWEDEPSLMAHAKSAHMATYRATLSKLRMTTRVVKRYDVSNVIDLSAPPRK